MLDKIVFQNGTVVTKEYLNEVEKGTSFSADEPRSDFYSEPSDGNHSSWEIGNRDKLKDWEIASPREEKETGIGRLAHDGIVLNSYDPQTGDKVWGPPRLIEETEGSGTYGVWVEGGSIVLSDGEPVSWGTQFVQLISGQETNYLYISETLAKERIAQDLSVAVSIGSQLPTVSDPHIPLAKLTVNVDGNALVTDEEGIVAGAGYVDLRPSVYIGNLNSYPRILRNTSIKSDSYSAESWERVIADTSNGSLIVTLPGSPTDSDRVAIVDISGSFDRFPIIIRPSGETTINGSIDDWIVNIRDAHLELFYHEATAEWKFEVTPGSECNPVLGTFLSCGGVEFIGQRLASECPDGNVVPVVFPEKPNGVYRYDSSTQKCYREYYKSVAVYADGEGGLIPITSAPRCIKPGEGTAITANSVKNIIYVDPAVGDDSLVNNGFDSSKPFRTIERALIEAVRESRRAGQYNDRYDRVMIELAPGDYYVDNSPGSGAAPSISAETGLIQRVATGYSVLRAVEEDRAIKIDIDVSDPTITQPPKALNLGRVLYSQSGGVGNIVRVEKTNLSTSLWRVTLEYVNGVFSANDQLYYDNLAVVNPSGGGLIVPRGISIDGVDLRKVRVRPMYVPELTPVQTEPQRKRTSIFKVTGGTYISLLTFTDNPQYSRTHNTVTSVTFASEAEIFGSGDETSYYSKLNSLFNAIDGWGVEGLEPLRAETTIVAPIASSKNLRQTDAEENQTGLPFADSRLTEEVVYPGPTKLVKTGSTGEVFGLPDINSTRSSSPYVFNCSVRSIFGLNGMWTDGALVSGFKSMVTANYTQVSLQTDPNCFNDGAYYLDPPTNKESGTGKQYLTCPADPFKYRHWGFRGSSDATIQIVSCFVIGNADHFIAESGADLSITNSCSDFGDISLRGVGYKDKPFSQDEGIPAPGYTGTRLYEVIPPLPLKYACKRDVNGEIIDNGNCFSDRPATLVDTEINTGLVIDYKKTEAYVVENAVGFNAPSVIRVYINDAENINQFSLQNPPSADVAAFGQFSYTKKNTDGTYTHAGGLTYANRRRIYINGFNEEGNSILYCGEIQLANPEDLGFNELDERSKVFVWDEGERSWYINVTTNTIVEEETDLDGDGYLLKKLDYAFRFKIVPELAPSQAFVDIEYIFDRSTVKIVRGLDSRKNDDRVYRIVLSGFDKSLGIRRPQPYYIVEKQTNSAGYPLNGSSELQENPLTVTQVRTYNEVFRPGAPRTETRDLDKYVTYLTTGNDARLVFTGDVYPNLDLDEPELTEDPSDSITKIALNLLKSRPGVDFGSREIAPSVDRITIKERSNSTNSGILINLRRPSVIRASGHTWEWTGYLNYDTAFPTFQGDPLESEYALGKIIVEENGGRVYATGMNEEGSYYIGTTVFDLRSGEQFAIPLKADNEPGNVTNQVLSNVIVKNTLLMSEDTSQIIFQKGGKLVLGRETEITLTVGDITAQSRAACYATEERGGFVQLAKRADIEGARNLIGLKGESDRVVVTALQLAQELDTRLSGFITGGTGVSVQVAPNSNNTDDPADDFSTFEVSIGQNVATTANVLFNSVTATQDICAFSDSRLKQNVIKIDNSLSKVERLQGVSYELKSDPGVPRLGLIAQDVLKVVPEVVSKDTESDLYKVSYQSLVPLLIEAVKELSIKVKSLEEKLG